MSLVPLLDHRAWSRPAERLDFAAGLRAGLEDSGFVIVEGHGIEAELIRRVYADFGSFFAPPEQEKSRYGGVAGGARGFTAFGVEHAKDQPTPDLKEFFHVGREEGAQPAGVRAYPPNRWPSEVKGLRESATELYARLEECADRLLEALALAYGLAARSFADMLCDGDSILRAAHYPPVQNETAPGALRAAPHEDINLITLLCEASDPGLEILNRGGWCGVECSAGQIVVDAGDMLSRVTGGVVRSTTHRVVNPPRGSASASRARFSLPFFVHPPPECDLSVLQHFATPERVDAYPPITAGDFLERRLREIGLSAAQVAGRGL